MRESPEGGTIASPQADTVMGGMEMGEGFELCTSDWRHCPLDKHGGWKRGKVKHGQH